MDRPFAQLRVLKFAIDAYHVRPKTVVLVMLTACWISQSGNDLGDNLKHYRAKKKTAHLTLQLFAPRAPFSLSSPLCRRQLQPPHGLRVRR